MLCDSIMICFYVSWLGRSFALEDFVVLKMDIEGAETKLLPRIFSSGAAALVDVFLWECHVKSRWCGDMERRLQQLQPNAIVYREPYLFPRKKHAFDAYMRAHRKPSAHV